MKMTQQLMMKQEDMNGRESDDLILIGEGDVVERRISVSGVQQTVPKPDSFVVNMDRFSHLIDKDLNANSRITRSLSRKGSNRGLEKKIAVDGKDSNTLTSSPRATLHASTVSEVTTGTNDHSAPQPQHHPITIPNSNNAPCDSKLGGKRLGFRRSPQTWIMDPRRILFLFATLSCMGTVMLIYFTLSIGKPSGDENALN